jgi:lipopolysaccharide biosynthesis regulator YciM
MINRHTGTDVRPWEVEDIPYEWIAAYSAMEKLPEIAAYNAMEKLPEMQENQNKAKAIFDQVIAKHPTFRKHTKRH